MDRNTRKPLNPFVLTGYVSPEYFCDREKETRKIISALRNGRNITLVSPRRMGKTGLIRHVFYHIETLGEARCFYIDLYQTDSLQLFVKKLGEAVLGALDTTEEKLVRRVSTFFKSLHPVITLDPITGEPGFSVNVEAGQAEHSLMEIFTYMEQYGKRCYVAFDEFQTVASYDDKNVEALLRAHIQHLTNVNFIFSGSQRHVLENMFATASRPFYQSTQMMPLGAIDSSAYYMFAEEKFESHGQRIRQDVFNGLFGSLHAHTWYVQSLLNRLYESCLPDITSAAVEQTVDDIVEENEATYQTFLRLITPMQAKVLRAVALEGAVREIQSKSFISRYGLGAASTVNTAAKALTDKELLLVDGLEYQVYDRFFAHYLRR